VIPIVHRVNSIEKLNSTPKELGVEVDIHAFKNELVITHDAYLDGENFEHWVKNFDHKLAVLNVKEEGIEFDVNNLMRKYELDNYFILDIPVPALIRFISATQETKVAARISLYESFDCALKLASKIDWVFVDLFENKFPITANEFNILKDVGLNVCVVSHELWARPEQSLRELSDFFSANKIKPDAILTKNADWWLTQKHLARRSFINDDRTIEFED
jgi:hypothetical protein